MRSYGPSEEGKIAQNELQPGILQDDRRLEFVQTTDDPDFYEEGLGEDMWKIDLTMHEWTVRDAPTGSP